MFSKSSLFSSPSGTIELHGNGKLSKMESLVTFISFYVTPNISPAGAYMRCRTAETPWTCAFWELKDTHDIKNNPQTSAYLPDASFYRLSLPLLGHHNCFCVSTSRSPEDMLPRTFNSRICWLIPTACPSHQLGHETKFTASRNLGAWAERNRAPPNPVRRILTIED